MSRLLISILALALISVDAISAWAETIRYRGSSTVLRGLMYKASLQFKDQEKDIEFDMRGKGTGVGIEKILAGECDIAGGGHPLSASEKAAGLIETPLFLDAYALIVHPQNPLEAISHGQLASILNGNVSSWGDFSEFQSMLKLVVPPPKAAHFKNFQNEFGFKQLPTFAVQVDTILEVYPWVKEATGAVGWLSYSMVWQQNDVKILSVKNGSNVSINQDNVLSGEYPYAEMQYFYTKGQPQGIVKKFIDFVKSPAGEKIILESGFFMPAQEVFAE